MQFLETHRMNIIGFQGFDFTEMSMKSKAFMNIIFTGVAQTRVLLNGRYTPPNQLTLLFNLGECDIYAWIFRKLESDGVNILILFHIYKAMLRQNTLMLSES